MTPEDIILKPIGIVRSDFAYRYETPRQGILAGDNLSVIELYPNNNFEQALIELDGFDRIWVLYQFHLNNNWKPQVTPPRHTRRKKVGVFATRAPYRPNQIGMSCVKLIKVEGLKIIVSESDILDGSPVIDIKPYLPYSDSFPDAKTGWAKTDLSDIFKVELTENAEDKTGWLKENANINLVSFARLQLEFNPSDGSRKRISNAGDDWILAYRTWRIVYNINEPERIVTIKDVLSGYSEEELKNIADNKYQDKELHKRFNKVFGKN